MITLTNTSIFHVHTFRCGHAENVPDEEYIKRAVELRATDIWFTDHAPFPGDPFGNRMHIETLSEYITSLTKLKKKYEGTINVHIGLEIEYLPSFDKSGYYKELKNTEGIDILLLGQHMAELPTSPVSYTFDLDKDRLTAEEFTMLGEATIDGMATGYFDVVAHPDRIFKRCKAWTIEMQEMSEKIIDAAIKYHIPLEQNHSSMRHKRHYWSEFWKTAKVEDIEIVQGLDAHKIKYISL